ncbi:hypothetical protein CLV98_109124 [Dyadobacter jejuensis]|uniref:Uncharacterized protein n=2 Tax=Dyadobacter jejuensis TaxID=1082580 RepID=A0A316AGZ8_9BACT|nr:hypothetical protein CLV98_109124 [Dyadobacter jejuensis]
MDLLLFPGRLEYGFPLAGLTPINNWLPFVSPISVPAAGNASPFWTALTSSLPAFTFSVMVKSVFTFISGVGMPRSLVNGLLPAIEAVNETVLLPSLFDVAVKLDIFPLSSVAVAVPNTGCEEGLDDAP